MKFKDIQNLTINRERKEHKEQHSLAMSYDQYREKLFEMHNKEPKINIFGATFTI
ncbi:hypothetical protein [Butyrivibrio sp. AE3004]|uniref:hypothetical protein n=1 Tax=Butyrivibrio sp. AE3004 TaxID=1506994 RepID=UPI000AF1180F|nr:hypothetical protein [Butyrivibrio sp. AE3004]